MEHIMGYPSFKEKILKRLEEYHQNEGTLRCSQTIKTNDQILTGIALDYGDGIPTQIVYLEPLYQEYIKTGDFDYITGKVIQLLMQKADIEISNFNVNTLQDKIICSLVGLERNKKLLKQVPYLKKEDMAIVFRVLLKNEEEKLATGYLNHTLMKALQTSPEELYNLALQNTMQELPPLEIVMAPQMVVITNETKTFGAATMLYQNLLKTEAEKLGGADLYVIPSSIHEIIICPDNGTISLKEYYEMVRNTNKTVVADEDILTDSIYHYSPKDDKIRLCKDPVKRKKEISR